MTTVNSHNGTHAKGHGALGSSAPPGNHKKHDLRGYISGAGAISIEFLMELLKLNTEIRSDMAQINMATTDAQNAVFTNQGEAAINLGNSQSQELTLQKYSAIVGSVVSGLQVGAGLSSGLGTRSATKEASMSQDQLTNYNKVSTSTELLAGDPESGPGQTNDPFAGEGHTPKDTANVAELRGKLAQNRVNIEDFNGTGRLEDMTLTAEDGTEYNAAKVIKSADFDERAEIGEKFVARRDQANKGVTNAQNEWQSKTQLFTTMGQGVSGGVDSWSKGQQAEQKQVQGAAQAVQSESQGAATLLGNAQKTVSDQRDSANQNVSQALQSIREIVQSDVRG